ncbi:MAG: hypothetical protein WC163_08720 [Sulfurovum sp.]|jgi:hypothetical protein
MKAATIFILALLLTLSTLSTANTMVSGIEQTSEESLVDFGEKHQSIDMETEDDKIYTCFFHTPYDNLAARIGDEEGIRFQYTIDSPLKPPEAFLA